MVIGQDLLQTLGLIINFQEKTVQWDEQCLKICTGKHVKANYPATGCSQEEFTELADLAAEPKDLLPDHLPPEVSRLYLDLLAQYRHFYDGHLGRMRLDDYVHTLSPEFKPVHAEPYPIPRSLENAARAEI